MNIRPKTVRRLLAVVVALAVLATAALGVRQYNDSNRKARLTEARNAGIAAFKQGDYPAAIEQLKTYIKPGTTDYDALLAFATSRSNVEMPAGKHLAEAIPLFEVLRSLRRDEPEVVRPLLDLYSQAGYSTEAIALADSVLAKNAADPDALKAKSIALIRSAKYEEALAVSRQWDDAAPSDLQAHLQTYWLLRKTKVPAEQIIARYAALLERHRDDPRFELLLGVAHGESGNREQALTLLRAAAARPAPDAEFVTQLARVFDQQRLFEESQQLLRRAAEGSNDPALIRVLVQRAWQDGEHDAVIKRLESLDPASPAADGTLLAFRAMSLLAIARIDEAKQIIEALKKRKNDNPAQGWAAAIALRMESHATPPAQLIAKYQSAMSRGGENGIIRAWIGDAHLLLGDTDQAVQEWRQSSELMPSWAGPHVKIARAMLAMNRPADAVDAALAAVRCAPDQVAPMTTLALAQSTLLQQNPSEQRQAALAALVAEIQKRKPGEPESLALHAAVLCRAGQKQAAIDTIRSATPQAGRWEPEVLANVLAVSREFGLNLEQTLLDATKESAVRSPAMALRHALEHSIVGKPEQGLAGLQNAAKSASSADAMQWQIAVAQFREAAKDPDAAATWIALGDSHADNFALQSLILRSAEQAKQNREFFARTIDRVRALTGEDGSLWKSARAQFLLTGQPNQRDSAEAMTLLADLVRASPKVPEYRVRLAQAMENMGNAREAADQLRTAAEIDPRSVSVQLELARLLAEQGKHSEARAYLDRAAQSPSIQPGERLPLARMLGDEGRNSTATMLLENAPSRDLQSDLLLADLYRRAGRLDDASALYDRRLQASPADADLIAAAADLLAARQNVNEARTILKKLELTDAPAAQKYAILARFEEKFGDRAAAKKHYTDAADASPNDASAWRRLASFHARQADYPAAVAAADCGLGILPGSADLQSLKLQAQAMQKVEGGSNDLSPLIEVLAKDPSRSAETAALSAMQETLSATQPSAPQLARLRQSADRFPRYLPLQSMLARSYLQTGANDDASNLAGRLLENLPGDAEAAALATTVYRATKQWPLMKQAALQWKRTLGPNPRSADLALAEACVKLNDLPQAINALQPHLAQATKKPEENTNLLRIAAGAMTALGQPERAEDLLGPLLAESSSARVTWLQVTGEYAREAAMASEALTRVEPVIDPTNLAEVDAYARSASILATRFADPAPARNALKLLAPFTQGVRADVEAMFLLASLQLQLNQTAAAEGTYRAILLRQPEHDRALNDLAYLLLLRKGDLQEARQSVVKARQLRPGEATYHETYARIEAELGNRDGALAGFDDALRIEPNNLDALIGKAFVLRQAGQTQQAERLIARIEPLLSTAPPLSEPVRVQLQSLRTPSSRSD